jgi:N-acetylglucosaminyl-diphospho-decaprenol L-rhamnosyltransferase
MSLILSIIIVAYRSRDEIEPCLHSLPETMDQRRVEVVVVDNCPADGTAAFVRKTFPRVRVIEPSVNLGFGRANNLGFAASSGEVVLFLNPDTVCNPEALGRGVQRLQSEQTLGLWSPRLIQADGTMDLACRRSIPTLWDGFCRANGLARWFPDRAWAAGYNLTHLPVEGTYDVGAINGAFMMGRRSVFEQVACQEGSDTPEGPPVFDPNFFMYGDDLDLCIRVAKAGYRIVYDGAHQIVHLKGQSVAKEYNTMSTAIFDANRDVFLKHFGRHAIARLKWRVMFGAWKRIALWRARRTGHRRVKPV